MRLYLPFLAILVCGALLAAPRATGPFDLKAIDFGRAVALMHERGGAEEGLATLGPMAIKGHTPVDVYGCDKTSG